MKFIDELELKVKAGSGGNGVVSFRREAHVPYGGPDGGDGGRGGNVYFVGDPGNNTLLNLTSQKIIHATDGENGAYKKMHGAKGQDLLVKVPIGTTVINLDNGEVIADVIEPIQYLIAQGGSGGKGNARFKTSQNSAPRICENGTPGQHFSVKLILKVLANVGFVGLPSAGKSTLLSRISNAKPKIADYDFTTLTPQLGLVKIDNNSFVVADLPGLISGASLGKGLGHQFLKHIERCRIIAHIIDMGSNNKHPIDAYKTIRKELGNFSSELLKRTEVIIANKSDLPNFKKNLENFKNEYPKLKVLITSGLVDHDFKEIKRTLFNEYQKQKDVVYQEPDKEVTITLEEEIIINNSVAGTFDVSGRTIQRIYNKIPLSTHDNIMRFKRRLKEVGLWKMLKDKNIKHGDNVQIYSYEFEWEDE